MIEVSATGTVTLAATTSATATATTCGPSFTDRLIDSGLEVALGYGLGKAEDLVIWIWHGMNGPGGCG